MKLTEEQLQKLRKLPTGNVADNNLATPHQGVMDYLIKPLDIKSHVVGRAFPVQCQPGDNLAFHQGIAHAKQGDVIVFACGGYTSSGHFGDMMANACKAKGIAGVIIDGTCRDTQDIIELGFPVFAKGSCPAGTEKSTDAVLHQPVQCGGIEVKEGDLIIGDCDGIVVIPQENEDRVIAGALSKFEHEKQILQELRSGTSTLDVYHFKDIGM